MKKKDLEALIFKISIVQGYYSDYMNVWTKCLKEDFDQKLEDVQGQICANRKKIKELSEEKELLEEK